MGDVGGPGDHGGGNVPHVEDLQDPVDVLGLACDHHPLLGFGHPDLPGCETGFLQRDLFQIHIGTAARIQRHLSDNAAQSAPSEVLHSGDELLLRDLDTGVERGAWAPW